MKTFKVRALTAAVLAGLASTPGLVYASTAANTVITNTVTVNFDDAAGNAQTAVQDSVNFTVNLLAAAPTLSTPADVDPASEDTNVDLVYTVTGNANGEDTYDFSIADVRSNMDADATLTAPVSVTLGGTTLAADAALTATSITVPYDGADDGDVNGIIATDTIIIGGNPYVVDSIDESTGAATNTVTINLTTAIAGTAGSTGDIVGERQDVTVGITTDFITAGTNGDHVVTATATSQADAGQAGSQAAATTITVRQPALAVTKYVRNVTTPVVGTTLIQAAGQSYYASDVSGQPGDTMEYLIVIDNTDATAGEATDIIVSDPIPQFTTYTAASMGIVTDILPAALNGATFTGIADAGDDSDAGEFDSAGNGTVYVYAGNGGDDDGDSDDNCNDR